MAAQLLATAIAMPPYRHPQEQIRERLLAWLAHSPELAAKAASIVDNGQVRTRHTVRPLDWYLEHASVSERSQVYREEMITLCQSAAQQALQAAGVAPGQVGLIISASCTGVMIPSVESYLIPRLGCGPGTRRQPLTELGCVAGAAAISQADHYLKAYPEQAVLIVTAELASLTAQVRDFSLANIVSASLFGDGAAAVVAVGERFPAAEGQGPRGKGPDGQGADGHPAGRPRARVLATRSVLFPDTSDLMGFDNTDSGLKIFLSPRVPRFLRQHLPDELAPFLEEHGVRRGQLRHFLLHPGGRKVLEGLERELGLSREDTRLSWEVLQGYGNLSSATVLVMLHHFERQVRPAPGDLGLLMAVGPGFCAELVLLQW